MQIEIEERTQQNSEVNIYTLDSEHTHPTQQWTQPDAVRSANRTPHARAGRITCVFAGGVRWEGRRGAFLRNVLDMIGQCIAHEKRAWKEAVWWCGVGEEYMDGSWSDGNVVSGRIGREAR